MRHPVVLAALGLVIAVVASGGIAALDWASNSGCEDAFGTRDADVSIQLVPFGLVCHYEADAIRPPETVVRAAGIRVFAAWLLAVGACVAVGVRRRDLPAARGLVSGICVLGALGFLATVFELPAAMFATALFGVAVPALVDLWLWPAAGRWLAFLSTALLLPFAVIVAWWFALYATEPVAFVVAVAAAAGTAAVFSRVRTWAPPRMEPL